MLTLEQKETLHKATEILQDLLTHKAVSIPVSTSKGRGTIKYEGYGVFLGIGYDRPKNPAPQINKKYRERLVALENVNDLPTKRILLNLDTRALNILLGLYGYDITKEQVISDIKSYKLSPFKVNQLGDKTYKLILEAFNVNL